MANYTVLRLICDGLSQAVNLKLNEEDGFVRMGGPFYEVLYLNPAPLNNAHIVASNVYGIPQFHLHYHHHENETVSIKWTDQKQFSVEFSASEPQKVICKSKNGVADPLNFVIQFAGIPSTWEKQMIASAIAWITFHKAEFSLINRNVFLSPQFPATAMKPAMA